MLRNFKDYMLTDKMDKMDFTGCINISLICGDNKTPLTECTMSIPDDKIYNLDHIPTDEGKARELESIRYNKELSGNLYK